MNKYKKFVKDFIMFYIAANVIIAVLLLIYAPNIIDKYFKGELTFESIVNGTSSQVAMVDPDYERVERLSEGLNLGAFELRECDNDFDNTTLACYMPHLEVTYVTELGLSQNDTLLYCTLKHEAIHKWQHETGRIIFDSEGAILNADELEYEAYANDGC